MVRGMRIFNFQSSVFNRRWIALWGLACLVGLHLADPVFAAPPPPFSPYGAVVLDGQSVPVGAVIGARCGGVQIATAAAQAYGGGSVYAIFVPGDDPDTPGVDGCSSGAAVTFTVDGILADQSAPWSADSVALNLSARRPDPTPTPTSTSTPTATPINWPTNTPTGTPTNTPTKTPTPTPMPTNTPTASATPSQTPTPTATPTNTPAGSVTATPSPSATSMPAWKIYLPLILR